MKKLDELETRFLVYVRDTIVDIANEDCSKLTWDEGQYGVRPKQVQKLLTDWPMLKLDRKHGLYLEALIHSPTLITHALMGRSEFTNFGLPEELFVDASVLSAVLKRCDTVDDVTPTPEAFNTIRTMTFARTALYGYLLLEVRRASINKEHGNVTRLSKLITMLLDDIELEKFLGVKEC